MLCGTATLAREAVVAMVFTESSRGRRSRVSEKPTPASVWLVMATYQAGVDGTGAAEGRREPPL